MLNYFYNFFLKPLFLLGTLLCPFSSNILVAGNSIELVYLGNCTCYSSSDSSLISSVIFFNNPPFLIPFFYFFFYFLIGISSYFKFYDSFIGVSSYFYTTSSKILCLIKEFYFFTGYTIFGNSGRLPNKSFNSILSLFGIYGGISDFILSIL